MDRDKHGNQKIKKIDSFEFTTVSNLSGNIGY